ncbi:putative transcription regulator mTERF family [Lupinus albus]|uniref:Putative transcription regulator mTERF family n=1 Tax=Lupinus albus TaxID=3870 RepID=A0A6A4P6F6_LUPAL|nr:putative transcription regulator mTERF family [Lupinus albus]
MKPQSMFKALLSLNLNSLHSATTKFNPFLHHFSFKFYTTTSDPKSFAVSYLINNFGFSPESALKASNCVHFKTQQKPDSVLTFFRNHGFSDSDLFSVIRKEPWLLSCDTHKRVLPKFQFLISKGASTSDIVRVVTVNPRFLKPSLENCIIPAYELNTVLELKCLGIDPSKSYFADAMLAKRATTGLQWSDKIDTFKKWGWSDETILEAFKKQPMCMLTSSQKVDKVMRFWVNKLGWDSSHLVKAPGIFGYSLEKRIIPRASVINYLLSKGLRKESSSFLTPFFMTDESFLEKFVMCFDDEEASQLLKLYRENMDLQDCK